MPISQTDQLFSLIKSLSKAEKRNFTIYSLRNENADSMFVKLFEFLDKQAMTNDKIILDHFPDLTKSKLSNVKRHLYSQILTSLRLIHINHRDAIRIREYIDFAEILYGKGLVLQSLKLLNKAANDSKKGGYDLLEIEINEFQKLIESRHITRTGTIKNAALAEYAGHKADEINTMIKLSNLRILIHGVYIRTGHVQNEEEYREVEAYFEQHLPPFLEDQLGFASKIFLYQSYVWYYNILIDFKKCYRYAQLWVDTCKEHHPNLRRDPELVLRGFHYLLTSAYNLEDVENYLLYSEEIEAFRKDNYKYFNKNTQVLSFLYVHHARFNKHFLLGSFDQGVNEIPRTLKRLKRYKSLLDNHRILIFYFKIAWMYFGNRDFDSCLNYLNRIIHSKFGVLRTDIQGYSRLLFLMAHFELGNLEILDYVFNNVKRYFDNYESKNHVQELILDLFKEIISTPLLEQQALFQSYYSELLAIKNNKYEQRPFLYLNIMDWLQSKIRRMPMAQIIKEKHAANLSSLTV